MCLQGLCPTVRRQQPCLLQPIRLFLNPFCISAAEHSPPPAIAVWSIVECSIPQPAKQGRSADPRFPAYFNGRVVRFLVDGPGQGLISFQLVWNCRGTSGYVPNIVNPVQIENPPKCPDEGRDRTSTQYFLTRFQDYPMLRRGEWYQYGLKGTHPQSS